MDVFFIGVKMLKEVIRFLFFQMPSIFLSGLAYIMFDKQEIWDVRYSLKKQKSKKTKKQQEQEMLIKYLERCKAEEMNNGNEETKGKKD